MTENVHKQSKSKAQRFLRLLFSMLDLRAYSHALKVINYNNYSHAQEIKYIKRGPNVRISPTASFANARNIELGEGTRIGAHCSLWAGNGDARIVLGRFALLAPNVMITTSNYRFNEGSPVTEQPMREADIEIGDDVWIGYGAIILPGSRIGDGAIIGAGALVKDEIPPYAIVANAPSPIVGYRRRQGEAR
ncbi:MAG: acyltransferase [Pseudomonadota bacterium]